MPEQQYEPGTHPDLPPPFAASGPVKWVRENLFSSPTNIALTVLAMFFLYKIIPGMFAWTFTDATFVAADRNECRALNSGACWAFIAQRWELFTYGFYPETERWRVIITFVLFVATVILLLWEKCPGRQYRFIVGALFPMVALWLIVGGSSTEAALMAYAAALVVAYFVYQRFGHNLSARFWFSLLAFVLVAIGVYTLWTAMGWSMLEHVSTDKFGGFMLTLIIGVTGITLSLPLGILLALGRQSNLPIIKYACIGFIEFIRGVPLITLLFVASTMLSYFLPPGTNFDLLLRVLIMVTLFASAYMAEVIRGGLQAVPKGQTEAADAMGLKYGPAMRLIVLPQALKISIPGIVNTFIGLYKDSVLVIVIGLLDPLGIGQASLADTKWQGLSTEVYLFVAIFFFVSCYAMASYSRHLEDKLHTGHKR